MIEHFNEEWFKNNPQFSKDKPKRNGGLISDWKLIEKNPTRVKGFVTDDIIWTDETITTSPLVKIDKENKELHTMNTIYKLGPQRGFTP